MRVMDAFPPIPFPHLQVVFRIGLALAMGLFVGLEREWRHKEAGLRTFGFVSMSGAIGGLLGPPFALAALALVGALLMLMNWPVIRRGERAELTTSASLIVTCFVGILCGIGHTFTPVITGIATAWLLAWKEQLADFSIGLTAIELRAAILLAVFAFVIYPVLPMEGHRFPGGSSSRARPGSPSSSSPASASRTTSCSRPSAPGGFRSPAFSGGS